jgi:hypothetical protein
MVTLELKKAGFGKKEKWPLLYAFADIYLNVASRNQPLNDTQVVEVAKQRYGLVVERRTVRKYRDYLSSYFGLRLETKNKGHYASNPIVVERKRRPRRNTFLERFENFTADEEEKESITKKARTIVSAINAGRCLSLLIPHWIDGEYGWDPYPLGPKRLVVIPLRIFQYRHEYYLLAYVPEEKSHYVFLIRNVTIKRSKAPRQTEDSVLDFDLETYVKKQAFLFTGPVSESDKPTYLEASWGNALGTKRVESRTSFGHGGPMG